MIQLAAITTRPLLPTDQEFSYQVYASTRLEELALIPWPDVKKEAFVRMQFEIRDQQYRSEYPEALTEIILCNDVPAGTLITSQTADTLFLVDIALLPHFRGAGIGARILQDLQAQGKKVILHVLKDNPAQHLYSRLGFVTVAEDSMYLGMEWNPR